ncbi:MAG: FtsX-like permease family protein, partial [Actinobacteria bacterium]|nr:FtsX-like permease family protein [Actinomycetota bacterium]
GGLTLTARTVIVSLIVGTVVTLLSAYSPARRAGRIPPVAAMREQSATTTTASLRRRTIVGSILFGLGVLATIAGAVSSSASSAASLIGLGLLGVAAGALMLAPLLSSWIIAGLGKAVAFGPVGRLARTNATRNPRRTAATAFALTLGLLLVSGIAVVGASTKASLNTIVDNDVRADYILNGNNFGVPIAAAGAARQVEGVQSVTELHPLEVTVSGASSISSGSGVDGPLSAVVRVDMQQGRDDTSGSSMIASKTTAKDEHWNVGTQLTLGEPDGPSATVTVVGIYADSPLLGPWLVSGDTYRALTPSNQLIDEVALVVKKPGTDMTKLGVELTRATDPYYVVDVQTQTQFKGAQASQINGLLGVLYGLLGLAIVIAILGIVNTLALSVVERRREIGMLRAIGMQRKQVRRTLYLESALIALFGALMGLVIGLTFGVLFTRTLSSQGLKTISVPWVQAVLFFVVAGIVGVVAAVWPGIRAARTKPLAAISGE